MLVGTFRKSETSFFLTAIPGYHAAATIARWILKSCTSIFKAHSVCSAGVSIPEIMEAGALLQFLRSFITVLISPQTLEIQLFFQLQTCKIDT